MDDTKYTDELVQLVYTSMRLAIKNVNECSSASNTILFYLCIIHDGATSGELKEYLNIGTGGIANALKDMEAKKMIIRRNDEADRRIVRVYLTDEGKKAALEKDYIIRNKIATFLNGIGNEDGQAMIRIMKWLIANDDILQFNQ